eukprot:scaffold127488_cov44-Attheya_sp.AAC.1
MTNFLEDFDWGAQKVILEAFAQTVREAEYSTTAFTQLASATVKEPWTMWHRPLTTILRPTPDGTALDRHHVFYQCNTGGTRTNILTPCNRKRSHAPSSNKSGPTPAPSKILRPAN